MFVQLRQHDRVRMLVREKRNGQIVDRIVFASVNYVEHVVTIDGKKFIYFGYTPESRSDGWWGTAHIFENPKPFGVQEVVVLGNFPPAPSTYSPGPNLVGDPGYDLMRDPSPRHRRW